MVTTETRDDDPENVDIYHLNIDKSKIADSELYTTTTGYLDSCATTSIIATTSLLTNIRPRARKMLVHGVNPDGIPLMITQEGDLGVFGTVPYHPCAKVNLLSQPELVDKGCNVEYNSPSSSTDPDTFFVGNPNGTRKFAFRRTAHQRGFYATDFALFSKNLACQDDNPTGAERLPEFDNDDWTFAERHAAFLGRTVKENMKGFTKRAVEQAHAARNLIVNMGCSAQKVIESLASITNCTVTRRDIINADKIFGPLISHLKGKTHKTKNAAVPDPPPTRESLPA